MDIHGATKECYNSLNAPFGTQCFLTGQAGLEVPAVVELS